MIGESFDGLRFEVEIDGDKDITDWDIQIQFKRGTKNGTIGKTCTVGNGITKTDAVNGVFSLDAFVIALDIATWNWVVIFKKDDYVKKWITGTLPVIDDMP